jgi:hypothetical protein
MQRYMEMNAAGATESRPAHPGSVPSTRSFGFARVGVFECRCVMVAICVIVLATCAFARGKDKPKDKKPPAATTVDSGSFGIFLNGKRIGTEKFSIEQQPDLGIITAELKVDDGTSKAEQTSEMRVAGDGKLKLYKWQSTVPDREEAIVEPKEDLLIEHLTGADQKKQDVPYILPLSTVILDDNFFSQRELLVWRYLATGCVPKDSQLACGPSRFGVLVPHQHMAANTTVELIGREKIVVKGVERELNKLKVDADGVQWLIWVDDPDSHYKVIKMAIPSSNIEVWRD